MTITKLATVFVLFAASTVGHASIPAQTLRTLKFLAKRLFFASCKVLMIFTIGISAPAYAVSLNANFRLFGEVERFGLGYGDMALHFGVNAPGNAPEIGRLGYMPGGVPFTTGVLSSVSLPGGGFAVIDSTFTVPFSLNVDQPASMYIGLGDNGINGPEGGSIQVIFDFSDNIAFGGSLLGNTRDQGLSLISVTMADGSSLNDAGLKFDFIPDNTLLTAFASAFDDQGIGTIYSTATPAQNRAAVFPFSGTATAKLRGISTEYLANLDVNPEPNPFTFDVAGATISGGNNVVLTEIGSPPQSVPEPSSIALVIAGLIGFGYMTRSQAKPGRNR